MPSVDPTSPERLKRLFDDCDALFIAVGRGFTRLADFDPFTAPRWFRRQFADLIARHGLRTIAHGLTFPYPSPVMAWAFYSRIICQVCYRLAPDLLLGAVAALVRNRPAFLATTNIDGWFRTAGFDGDRMFEMGGSLTQLACRWRCCEKTYPALPAARAILAAGVAPRVAPDLLPNCPRCGGPLMPSFARDGRHSCRDDWSMQAYRLHSFLQAHRNSRLLILDLGVSPWNHSLKALAVYALRHNPRATWLIAHDQPGYLPADMRDRIIVYRKGIPLALLGLLGE